MKSFLLILSFAAHSTALNAQSFIEVTNIGTQYSEEQIVSAFESGNFCPFFYATKRNILTLDDGSIVELLSIQEQELSDSGCGQLDEFIFPEAVWSISNSGIVMRKLEPQFTKKAE